MKSTIKYGFSMLVLLAGLNVISYAQTQDTNQPDPNQVVQDQMLSNKDITQQLQKDFAVRNPSLPADQAVTWYDAGNSYYGTYDVGNVNYITRYDNKGNYVETLTKKIWDDQTNPRLKSAIEQGPYKASEVTGYWESSSQTQKGYYLELQGQDGKKSRVWVNEKNQFSKAPYATSVATTKSKNK